MVADHLVHFKQSVSQSYFDLTNLSSLLSSFLSNLFKRKTEAQKLEAAEKKYATATTKLQTATQKSEQAWNESIRVAKSKESLASFAVADVKSMFAGLKRKIAERNQQAAGSQQVHGEILRKSLQQLRQGRVGG